MQHRCNSTQSLRSRNFAKLAFLLLCTVLGSQAAQAAPILSGYLFVDYDRDGNPYVTSSGGSTFDESETGDGTVNSVFAPATAGSGINAAWSDFSIQAVDVLGTVEPGTIDPTNGYYEIDLGKLQPDDFLITVTAPGDYTATHSRNISSTLPVTSGATTRPLQWHIYDINADLANQHIGVLPPSLCAASGDVYATCFVKEDVSTTGAGDTVVTFAYDGTGKAPLLDANTTGSTWALAHDEWRNVLFAGSYLKRGADLGSEGLDGLYWVDDGGTTYSASLSALSGNSYGSLISDSDGCDTDGDGSDIDTSQPTPDFATMADFEAGRLSWAPPAHTGPTWAVDCEAYDKVGRVSLGDIDVTPDGDTLLVMNLAEKKLEMYDVTLAQSGTISFLGDLALTAPGCGASDWHPFAVDAVDGGYALVGITCTDGTTALVEKVDLSLDAPFLSGQTNLQTVPLDYDHSCAYTNDYSATAGCNDTFTGDYRAWSDVFEIADLENIEDVLTGKFMNRPTPMLSDIGYESDGSLSISIRDRFADQWAPGMDTPDAGHGLGVHDDLVNGHWGSAEVFTAGDILKMCNTGTHEAPAWDLEGSGSCTTPNFPNPAGSVQSSDDAHFGPGGEYEWYGAEQGAGHTETSNGGIFAPYRQNQDEIVVSLYNGEDLGGGNRGSVAWWNIDTGVETNALDLYAPGDGTDTFGKASGIGDIEGCLLTEEIGDRVWYDADGDGVQDPGEAPIPGATVSVTGSVSGAIITVQTDANGYWYVDSSDGLAPGEAYTIVIDLASATLPYGISLADIESTRQNVTPVDLESSLTDGDYVTAATYEITTPVISAGEINHTFDAGFYVDYDLALAKTVKGTPVTNGSGEITQVTFDLTITNQGAPVECFEVDDYIDTTYWKPFIATDNNVDATFATATGGTVANAFSWYWDATSTTQPVAMICPTALRNGPVNNATGDWSSNDSLLFKKNETIVISITLDTADPLAGTVTELVNFAEISKFDNDAYVATGTSEDSTLDGTVLEDEDSTPDGTNESDAGETRTDDGGVADDNEINEDAAANPGVDDEDDHDFEAVPLPELYDLALVKELSTGQSATVAAGDTVDYTVTVKNQGAMDSGIFSVVDAIPAGMTFSAASGTGFACSHDGSADGGLVTCNFGGNLTTGQEATFELTVNVVNVAMAPFRNWAEIEADSGDDVDSDVADHDGVDGTAGTGTAGSDPVVNHNDIDHAGAAYDERTEDEDDSDFEDVDVAAPAPEYDLALIKELKTGQSATVAAGDTVEYTITVRNQGVADSGVFSVVDVIPAGLTFVSATGVNFACTHDGAATGGEVTCSFSGNLTTGQDATFELDVTVGDVTMAPFRNWAEIETDSGDDNDSQVADHNAVDGAAGTGTAGSDPVDNHNDITLDEPVGDEDDSDFEDVDVAASAPEYDLALIKELKTGQSATVAAGDTVEYTITVRNQGVADSGVFSVVDVIPAGLTFVSATGVNFACTHDGAATGGEVTCSFSGNLTTGQDATFELDVTVGDVTMAPFRNWAEIETDSGDDNDSQVADHNAVDGAAGTGTAGSDAVNNHNDITLDEPVGDEDDSDFEDVDVAASTPDVYDLALVKRLATGQSAWINNGDTVDYEIQVKNQGTVASLDFVIEDRVPTGMQWVNLASYGPNVNCLHDGSVTGGVATCTYTSTGPTDLLPNAVTTILISLTVVDLTQAPFANWAEITEDSSADYGLTDDDSVPADHNAQDTGPGDTSSGGDPFIDQTDVADDPDTPATEEDDSDPAYVFSASTTPITLESFGVELAQGSYNALFNWTTSMEDANVGFNLYGRKSGGDWQKLNDHMIPAQASRSDGHAYSVTLVDVDAEEFAITDVDVFGKETVHGPFSANRTYGLNADDIDETIADEFAQEVDEEVAVDAAAGAVYLKIRQSGVHRVTFEELQTAGYDWSGIRAGDISVSFRGKAVPVRVVANSSGGVFGQSTFGKGGYVEFVADTEESLLSSYTIYKLALDPDLAERIRIDGRTALGDPSRIFRDTIEWEEDAHYSRVAPSDDPWYARKLLALTLPTTTDIDVEVPDVVSASGAKLTVNVWGANDDPDIEGDHHLVVAVNDQPVIDEIFDGVTVKSFSGAIPEGVLVSGNNRISVSVLNDNGADIDIVHLDSMSIEYDRQLVLDGGSLTIKGAQSVYTVDGSDEAVVYRRDQRGAYRLPVAAGVDRVTFAGTGDTAEYFVVTESGVKTPRLRPVPTLGDMTGSDAEYLVIAHRKFIGATLDRLVAARQADGLTTKVVDVEWIYDVYAGGNVSSDAIRAYISYAVNNLDTRYVVLVGGDTYDYRNLLGKKAKSFIPTLYAPTTDAVRHAPVDPLYGDVDNNGVPDVAVGRFPVQKKSELRAMVDKTLQYAQADYGSRAVMAADKIDDSSRADFASMTDDMVGVLPESWSTKRVYLSKHERRTARRKVMRHINQGAALTTWMGHSDQRVWSFDRLLRRRDVRTLGNVGRPTVLTQYGCWNNYYVQPDRKTMANAWLMDPDRGAAVVTGASALTEIASEQALSILVTRFMTVQGLSVGEAVLAAKHTLVRQQTLDAVRDVVSGYVILGDPAVFIAR